MNNPNIVSNGRLDIMGPNLDVLFSMRDHIPANQNTSFKDAMTGNWYDTVLSNAFFSAQNIRIIQNGIRAGVYKRSNGQYLISDQNPDELKIIMRSIFLQHSKNLATNIPQQIAELNDIVLDYCVGQVYGEAEGYMKYKRDVSTLVIPIERPVMSTTNEKQLELKHWF